MRLFKREKRNTVDTGSKAGVTFLSDGQASYSQGRGSVDRSLKNSTVYACATTRAGDIGALPKSTYEIVDGRKIPFEMPEWLQRPDPNEDGNHHLFQQIEMALALTGNAFVWIVRSPATEEILSLIPIDGSNIRVKRLGPYWAYYVGNSDVPVFNCDVPELSAKRTLIHIKAANYCGPFGLSPIQLHVEDIDKTISARSYVDGFYQRGFSAGTLVEVETDNEDELRAVKQVISQNYSGSRNAYRSFVSNSKITVQKNDLPILEQTFLDSNKMDVLTICSIFKVPASRINLNSFSSPTGVAPARSLEEESIIYAGDLAPEINRIEAAFSALLPDNVFFNLDEMGLIKMDSKGKSELLYSAFQAGSVTPNEYRQVIGQPLINDDWADSTWIPLNHQRPDSRKEMDERAFTRLPLDLLRTGYTPDSVEAFISSVAAGSGIYDSMKLLKHSGILPNSMAQLYSDEQAQVDGNKFDQ